MSGEDSSLDSRRLDPGRRGMQESGLDSHLWARLPESLMEEIQAKLPFSSLVRFCCVSKKWRDSILSSETFLWYHPHLLYFTERKLMILSSRKRTWEPLSLDFLELHQHRIRNIATSVGGLLCFRTVDAWDFIVCNPITKCYKRLQPPCTEVLAMDFPQWESSSHSRLAQNLLVGMVLDGDTGHFKLIVGGFCPGTEWVTFLSRGSQWMTLVYDSRAESWTNVVDIFPQGISDNAAFMRWTPTVWQGNLYFACLGARKGERILKYDVEEQAWSLILAPRQPAKYDVEEQAWSLILPPRQPARQRGARIPCSCVVLYNGKFLLVTQNCTNTDVRGGYEVKFQVSELQDAGYAGPTEWLPTKNLPFSHVCQRLPSSTRIDRYGRGDVLFIITMTLPPFHKITSVSCHNFTTSSNLFSNWEDEGCANPDFKIFMPSTILVK